MVDNSIITKFELSEREKRLKADFFSRKTNKLEPKVSTNEIEESKNNIEKIPEEDLNNFYNQNKNDIEPLNVNTNNNFGISPQQMNIIYTQNKLMERNVDILQETNRSLQDFIIYNMRKDELEKGRNKLINPMLKEVLNPLYENINELKEQVKDLSNKQNDIKNSQSENKFNDLTYLNNEMNNLKTSTLNKKKGLQVPKPINKYEQPQNKENQRLIREISNLKNTMSNLTQEMNKLGTTFNEKLNKVVEDTENKKLKNIIGKPKIDNLRDRKKKDPHSIKNKILDEIDYNDLKNDLNEINFEKDKIINEFNSNKPEMEKLEKPKQKVNFSYNLDYPTSPSTNLNITKSSISEFDTSKNIFNQNLANINQISKQIPNQKIQEDETLKKQKIISEKKIPQTTKVTYQIKKEEKIDYSKLSVMDRMNEYKKRMNEMKGQVQTFDNSKKYVTNQPQILNPFEDPSMRSQKSVITLQTFQKEPNKTIYEYNPIPEKPKYEKSIIPKDIGEIKPINRNEITMVQVAPGEPEQRKNIEDELLKICIDKMVTKDLPGNNEPYKNEVEKNDIFSDEDYNNLTKEQIEDYIRNAIRIGLLNNKPVARKENVIPKKIEVAEKVEEEKKIPIRNNEIVHVMEKEIITNNKINNENNEILERLILSLEQKFGGIESALNNLNNRPIPNNIYYPQPNYNDINIDEITRKIKERTQMKTKINIRDRNNQNFPSQRYNKNLNLSQSRSSLRISSQKEPSKIIKDVEKNQPNQIFDENTKIKIEELDEIIRMPHKINLDEYDVSQTSSYISDINNNTYNMIKFSEQHIIQNEINESEDDDSISKGQDVSEDEYDEKGNFKGNKKYNKNRTGLDLLMLKSFNENLPKQVYNMEKYKNFGYNKEEIPQIYNKMRENKKEKSEGELTEEEQSEINTDLKPNNYNFSNDKFENNIPLQKQSQNENINSDNLNFEYKESKNDDFFHDSQNDED